MKRKPAARWEIRVQDKRHRIRGEVQRRAFFEVFNACTGAPNTKAQVLDCLSAARLSHAHGGSICAHSTPRPKRHLPDHLPEKMLNRTRKQVDPPPRPTPKRITGEPANAPPVAPDFQRLTRPGPDRLIRFCVLRVICGAAS